MDCNPFIRNIYGHLEFAYGGQWIQHFENVKSFVETFQKAGFELVIIFDSVIEKKKIKTWVDRRKKERKLVSRIFQDIKTKGRHPTPNMFHIPPGLSTFTRLALKCLGVSVHNSTMEVDREFYLYTKKHQCFGVVSKDTDLLIYDIPEVFFLTYSSGHIQRSPDNSGRMSCATTLGFRLTTFPLFACLVGCDTIKPFMLSKFHNMVTRGRRDPLIPCVAGFIRSLQLRDMSRRPWSGWPVKWTTHLGNGFLFECVQELHVWLAETSTVPSKTLGMSSSSGEVAAARIDPGVMSRIKACHEDLSITGLCDAVPSHKSVHCQYDIWGWQWWFYAFSHSCLSTYPTVFVLGSFYVPLSKLERVLQLGPLVLQANIQSMELWGNLCLCWKSMDSPDIVQGLPTWYL